MHAYSDFGYARSLAVQAYESASLFVSWQGWLQFYMQISILVATVRTYYVNIYFGPAGLLYRTWVCVGLYSQRAQLDF
jgi:hypothetical protein